ncbi:hypothetical protein SacglDRAFT_03288 [Saccharomonospora glauca K62]|uniref:Integral membrane bound transporter domain-containing protein n=1 Tax=Saccharomonospora glauca K62 TaxID=928724 RepID=I1D5C5_9PSEU|nr:hypothetical protein SacglDRAFT_03288 [Saccharomonospora glauca K62]
MLLRDLPHTFRIRRTGPLLWPACRALLAMIVPLGVLLVLDRLDLVAAAVFGALTSVYSRNDPYRRQLRTLAAVGVGMVLAVTVGDLVAVTVGGSAAHVVVALLATALVGALATMACTAVGAGAPGGLMFAFATGACAHLPLSAGDLPAHLGIAVASAALAWTVSYAGARVRGLKPQREAVARALEATAAHLDSPAGLETRHRAAVAVDRAMNCVAEAGTRHRASAELVALTRAVATCESVLVEGEPHEPDPASLRRFAHAVRRGVPPHPTAEGEPTEPFPRALPESRGRTLRELGVAALRPGRHPSAWLLPYAARVGVAAFAAGVLTHLVGIGHAYWAAVSAVSVLQATSTSTSVPRMVQRVAGTVFGALLGLALLGAHPAAWAVVLLIALLQWGAEMTVTVNYAFGLFFATPVALLVSALGSSAPPHELVADRTGATLVGAAVAVLVARLAPKRAWLSRVELALSEVRRLAAAERPDPARLRAALLELHEAYDIAAGEVPAERLPTEELLTVSHHAYRVLDGREPALGG